MRKENSFYSQLDRKSRQRIGARSATTLDFRRSLLSFFSSFFLLFSRLIVALLGSRLFRSLGVESGLMLILSSRPSRFFAKAIRRSSRIIPRFWVYSGHDFSKFSSSARLSATVESRLASFEFACSCFFHPSSAHIFALGRP